MTNRGRRTGKAALLEKALWERDRDTINRLLSEPPPREGVPIRELLEDLADRKEMCWVLYKFYQKSDDEALAIGIELDELRNATDLQRLVYASQEGDRRKELEAEIKAKNDQIKVWKRAALDVLEAGPEKGDRKSTRLNSSHWE